MVQEGLDHLISLPLDSVHLVLVRILLLHLHLALPGVVGRLIILLLTLHVVATCAELVVRHLMVRIQVVLGLACAEVGHELVRKRRQGADFIYTANNERHTLKLEKVQQSQADKE